MNIWTTENITLHKLLHILASFHKPFSSMHANCIHADKLTNMFYTDNSMAKRKIPHPAGSESL